MSQDRIPVDIGAFPPGQLAKLLGGRVRGDARPYYTEAWGMQAMEIAKAAINGAPQALHDDGAARNTIRQRYYQGMAFAADQQWPNALQFKDATKVTKIIGRDYVVRKYNPFPADQNWRQEIITFIQNSSVNENFIRMGMSFTPSDLAWLESISQQDAVANEFQFNYNDTDITIAHHEPYSA